MKRLVNFNPIRTVKEALGANGIFLIVVAAVLLIAINIIQYEFAENEINEDLKLRALSELSSKSLAIRNIMTEVETAVRNHTEDVERQLEYPDSMFGVAKNIVEQNPIITGSSVSFIPYFYKDRGKWFEAFAVRGEEGEIQTMQLGNENHDYLTKEFFTTPIETGEPVWTNPYLDSEGAKMMLTTYSRPVFDKNGNRVAIVDADISLDWLEDILTVEYAYPSSYHILVSKKGQLMSVADRNYIMKTIPEMAEDYKNSTFNTLNDLMMGGESGETVIEDRKGQKYRVFYMPVGGETGWSIAIINSEKEIFGDFHRMKVTMLWLSIGGFLIILLIMIRAILNIKKLQKVTTEQEIIMGELKVASDIQKSMLPRSDSLASYSEELEVASSLEPAKEVGGDLYDYFVKGNYLYFCIGDVSGKGVPAAMFMTVTRSLFRTIAPYTKESAKVMGYMNNTLADINEANMFVTLFIGILDLKTGEMNFCNAGHNGPVIINKDKVEELEVIPNLALGIFPDFSFSQQKIIIPAESIVFLYTDGLTEAMDESHHEYTEQRMLDELKNLSERDSLIPPRLLLEKMTGSVKKFVGKAEQSDDLTMVAIYFKGEKHKKKSILLKNDLKEIQRLNEFMDSFFRDEAISEKIGPELKLAVEEAVVNVINYSYPSGSSGNIEIIVDIIQDNIKIEIRDQGVEFDPTEPREIDTEAGLDEREIGGLGIFLLQQIADVLTYKREFNSNILTITKHLRNENDGN